MSITINKDNIFVVVPNNKYNSFETIGDCMENDFTIFVRAKIDKESLNKNEESFFIARNGQHSGISVIIDDANYMTINFTYWLQPSIFKQIKYKLSKEIEGKFNNLIMKCDMKEKKISCYVNQFHAGDIDFNEYEKVSYMHTFIWLGSCNMILDEKIEDQEH